MHDLSLQPADDAVEQDAHRAQDDERRENAGDVGDRLRLGDHHAHPLLGAEELGDDGAQQCVDHRHVEAGEDIGRGVGKLDDAIGFEARGRERAHQVDPLGLDGAQAGEAVDQHREEGEQRRDRDLRAVTEPEPDHHQRRDRDLRQRLQSEGIGHD